MTINKGKVKKVATLVGVFVAYKMYELYQTGAGLIVNYQKFQLSKANIDSYGNLKSVNVNVTFSLFNTRKSQIKLNGISGKIKVKGNTVATINPSEGFVIKQGSNVFSFSVTVNGTESLQLIKESLKKGLPVFTLEITYKVPPFFSYTDSFDIPPSDYLIDELQPLLQFL
jgi:hypothetical protein